jgi:hypothetical protein
MLHIVKLVGILRNAGMPDKSFHRTASGRRRIATLRIKIDA